MTYEEWIITLIVSEQLLVPPTSYSRLLAETRDIREARKTGLRLTASCGRPAQIHITPWLPWYHELIEEDCCGQCKLASRAKFNRSSYMRRVFQIDINFRMAQNVLWWWNLIIRRGYFTLSSSCRKCNLWYDWYVLYWKEFSFFKRLWNSIYIIWRPYIAF